MDNPTGQGFMAEIAALSAREDELNALCLDYQIDLDAARQDIAALQTGLQTVAASINGILDRRMSAGQCIEIIKKHIARTNEMVNDLRQEAADWRNAKAIAESKETAVHLALNDMRAERDAFRLLPAEIAGLLARFKFESSPHDSADATMRRLTFVLTRFDEIVAERDALKTELHEYRYAVQHVTEDGNTTCSYSTSAGWAMVHADRLMDLEVAEEERDKLLKVREAADVLVDALSSKCRSCEEACCHCGFPEEVKAYKEARDG